MDRKIIYDRGFPEFYHSVLSIFGFAKTEYRSALDQAYKDSRDYREALHKAYEKDGYDYHVDLTEPKERIRFEMHKYFSPHIDNVETRALLGFVRTVVYSENVGAIYNLYFVSAAHEILDALVTAEKVPTGTVTVGEMLKSHPPRLPELPEFFPRISDAAPTSDSAQRIGPRSSKGQSNTKKFDAA